MDWNTPPAARIDATGPMDHDWARRFAGQVRALQERPDIRAVVIASEGPAFSVGGDLRAIRGDGDVHAAVHDLASIAHEGFAALLALPQPVIARVQGVAAGLGFSLALAADVVVAGASATFTSAYTRVGLSPDGAMTWTLPRLIGPRRALELIASAREVSADEAAALGIATEIVADDALDAAVARWVALLADRPAAALAASKRLVRQAWDMPLAEQLDAEAASVAELAASPSGVARIAAFLDRGAPDEPRHAPA